MTAPRDAPHRGAAERAAALGVTPPVEDVLDAAERHLEWADFHGWDPYDALCSPVFRLPGLRTSRRARLGAQQVVKRSSWNLRPLLRIAKQLNPVSLGLYIQGQAIRAGTDPRALGLRRPKVVAAVRRLAELATPGYSGVCWGYPFDWETRYGSIPASTPTIVATGMIANGLWQAYKYLGIEEAGDLVLGAAEFVKNDLPRIDGADGTFCWSYSPQSDQAVLNATLKGSRLLAQAHQLEAAPELLDLASRSVRFVAEQQLPSGAWPYSLQDTRADNFHSGYVLECLREYRRLSGARAVDCVVARGWAYYRENFFTKDLIPKYYDSHVQPLDATACAQAIITLSEFEDLRSAARVAQRSVELLGQPDGSFAYQRRGHRTVRTPFLRWSTAWMYCALSRLSEATAVAAGECSIGNGSQVASSSERRDPTPLARHTGERP